MGRSKKKTTAKTPKAKPTTPPTDTHPDPRIGGGSAMDSTGPDAPKEPTPIVAVTLGKTARAVLLIVINATFPEEGDGEVVTARTVADRATSNLGQTRTILRQLREKGLVLLADFSSKEDRTFRYEAAPDAGDRLGAGDEERAKKAATKKPSAATADPMAVELYTPLALKLAAIDRACTRWTGTAYRERKAIRDASDDPEVEANWSVHSLNIDGEDVKLTAPQVGVHLRTIREKIVADASFMARQRLENRDLMTVVKGDDAEAEGSDDADASDAATPAAAAAK